MSLIYLGVILSIAVEMVHKSCAQDNSIYIVKPKYLMPHSSKSDEYDMSQVRTALERFGYKRTTNKTPWDLLWTRRYTNSIHNNIITSLKPHQKFNHFPCLETIGEKHIFSTRSVSKNIPKAFELPKDKNKFWKYASENKKAMFVEKNNGHRGVKLTKVKDVDLGGHKFVQEFIQNPFLVDNYKFDIGVFVVITSVEPLRMYYYNGDVFLRFCPVQYYPFDPLNVNKYVVADNYRPIWRIPALVQMHNMGYSMRNSLNFYLRSQGKDPRKIWEEIFNVIRDNLVNKMKSHVHPNNFFSIFRVDLILDKDMNVHLLEANILPQLVSSHAPFYLLNDQVLFSLFSLVGLDSPFRNYNANHTQMDCGKNTTKGQNRSCIKNIKGASMLATNKNIAVWATECVNLCKERCDGVCSVCLHCLTFNDRVAFIEAYREHLRQGDLKRLFPSPMTPSNETLKPSMKAFNKLTPKNRLMYLWYQGKCNADVAWCN